MLNIKSFFQGLVDNMSLALGRKPKAAYPVSQHSAWAMHIGRAHEKGVYSKLVANSNPKSVYQDHEIYREIKRNRGAK